MRFKFLSLLAAVVLVAACESANTDNANTVTGGAASSTQSSTRSSVVPGSQEDLKLQAGDRVFFALNRFDLSPEARATLDKQVAWLRSYPSVTVTIEGHADERGTREYNLALGEKRANSIKRYLVAQGVDTNRVATISYGKERPEVLGSGESVWQQNRRGVTTVN